MRLCDPVSGAVFHVVPGGAVEPGESPARAAQREAWEETGLEVVVDESSELVATYPFVWAGTPYETTTHFFRASPKSESGALPELTPRGEAASYELGPLWLPLRDADRVLAFHDAIWRATRALMSPPSQLARR